VPERTLLVTSAGTGASNNLIRSLKAGDPSACVVGCHSDRFIVKKSLADRNYLIPRSMYPEIADVVLSERVDLLIPSSDADVRTISDLQAKLPCRVFLPRSHVIERCQDKYDLTVFLRSRELAAPVTFPVEDLNGIDDLFRKLAPHRRLWCRIRTGAGSMGAIPVEQPEQARSWIAYWEQMRGVPATSFTLSEYLPGRDFSLQCLWKDGDCVLAKMSERLAYFVMGNSPSGVSSTPALAKTVFERRVVQLCHDAILALDERASGVFCFDLKENTRGVPCITEINAGRFAMITNIYDLTGKHNMASTYVRLALDAPVVIPDPHDYEENCYLVRDLDTTPGIFRADELLEGVGEVRG
jgi:hypothetical protein